MSSVAIVGLRVVRGVDWEWADQDGGEGHVGTIMEAGGQQGNTNPEKTVIVMWDSGIRGSYRAGYQGKDDLRVLDNASTGVRHTEITCDVCHTSGVCGMRWKCAQCHDFDLCHECYMSSKHDPGHMFVRFNTSQSQGVKVTARAGARRIQAKGLYQGAKVQRGPGWPARYGDQDGGAGRMGTVSSVGDASDGKSWRSWVKVKWEVGKANDYRRGAEGLQDLKCATAANGEQYYVDHLPTLGEYRDENAVSVSLTHLSLSAAAPMVGLACQTKKAKKQKKARQPAPSSGGYHFTKESFVKVAQGTGHVCYNGPSHKPVALIVAQRPFSDEHPYFEIEIVNNGEIGAIAVGAVPQHYPDGQQPGWTTGGIGYHADDGGIFIQQSYGAQTNRETCTVGDTMGCGLEFNGDSVTVYFTKNGNRVFQTPFGDRSCQLYPAVGMHSHGEEVRLLDASPWRDFE